MVYVIVTTYMLVFNLYRLTNIIEIMQTQDSRILLKFRVLFCIIVQDAAACKELSIQRTSATRAKLLWKIETSALSI